MTATELADAGAEVGFVGLGRMGEAMAFNLCADGLTVRVWNRSPAAAQRLRERGATVAASPAGVARVGGVVISMLRDDAALEAVTLRAGGLAEALGKGGLHIGMSTLSPPLARRLAAAHAAHGGSFLCAPVQGPPPAAAARQLTVWMAGDVPSKQRAAPLLQRLSARCIDLGDDAAAAASAKLALNFLMFGSIALFAEAMAFAQANGVSPEAFAQGLTDTVFAAPFFRAFVPGLLNAAPEPGSGGLAVAHKDLLLLAEQAWRSAVRLPLAEATLGHYGAAVAQGLDTCDASAVSRAMRSTPS